MSGAYADPLLLAQAARLLGKLSNNEEAAALLHKIVNIRELIAAMRRNIKNEEFLKYAVFLLGNLAQNEQICVSRACRARFVAQPAVCRTSLVSRAVSS